MIMRQKQKNIQRAMRASLMMAFCLASSFLTAGFAFAGRGAMAFFVGSSFAVKHSARTLSTSVSERFFRARTPTLSP